MKVGILVTGDVAVRAAHSLAASPLVEEVVVIGPATSRSFKVVDDAGGCDYLIGHGERALEKAEGLDVPLIWDGDGPQPGVAVWGASPGGMTLSLGARESDPRLIAVAHPSLAGGSDQMVSFPKPVGRLPAADSELGGKRLAQARSGSEFAACLVEGAGRSVAIVDDGAFLSGVALAAGIAAAGSGGPVWESALPYLQSAADMGLVLAEGL